MSILKINKFLEEAVKEGKISKGLYNHLKGKVIVLCCPCCQSVIFSEALIETVVEGIKKDTNSFDSLDYGQY